MDHVSACGLLAKDVCILTGGNKPKVESEQAGTERALKFNTFCGQRDRNYWTLVIQASYRPVLAGIQNRRCFDFATLPEKECGYPGRTRSV